MSEDRKDEVLIKKTRLETRLLAQQLTPSYRRLERLKTVVGASGLIIALVTVVGGFLSVGNWFLEQKKTRQIRTEERLDRALTMLADENPGKRLAAVTSLRSFLSKDDDGQNTQVLLAFAGRLALDDSAPVRNTIVSTIEDLDVKVISTAVLNRGLQALGETSRSLMQEGDIWRTRPQNLWRLEKDAKVGARLQATAEGIVALLRKGARTTDLTGIYIGRSDLTGMDLSGISFDDTILAWSDFTEASLVGASFNGTDLEETKFVRADLRNSKFTFSGKRGRSGVRWDYVERQMSRSPTDQVQVDMPDFSCSDLRNADFTGHSLFGVAANDIPELSVDFRGPNFRRANLGGADLSNIQVFGLADENDHRFPFYTVSGSGFLPEEAKYVRHTYRIDPDAPLAPGFSDFSTTLNYISYALADSNWRAAQLPKAVREWLDQKPPPENQPVFFRGQKPCEPRARW